MKDNGLIRESIDAIDANKKLRDWQCGLRLMIDAGLLVFSILIIEYWLS